MESSLRHLVMLNLVSLFLSREFVLALERGFKSKWGPMQLDYQERKAAKLQRFFFFFHFSLVCRELHSATSSSPLSTLNWTRFPKNN